MQQKEENLKKENGEWRAKVLGAGRGENGEWKEKNREQNLE